MKALFFVPDPVHLASQVNRIASEHLSAWSGNTDAVELVTPWELPPKDFIKVNYDVATVTPPSLPQSLKSHLVMFS